MSVCVFGLFVCLVCVCVFGVCMSVCVWCVCACMSVCVCVYSCIPVRLWNTWQHILKLFKCLINDVINIGYSIKLFLIGQSLCIQVA